MHSLFISLSHPGQEGDQEGKLPLASGLVGPPWWDITMTLVPDSRTEQTEALNGADPMAGHLCLGRGNQCVLPANTDLGFLGPTPRGGPARCSFCILPWAAIVTGSVTIRRGWSQAECEDPVPPSSRPVLRAAKTAQTTGIPVSPASSHVQKVKRNQ